MPTFLYFDLYLNKYTRLISLTQDSFFVLGTLLSMFVPRCTDPCADIRQDALSAIQTILQIAGKFEGALHE